MERIDAGLVIALYLFDVAEAADLKAAAALVGGSVPARLAPKPATPAYVQYQQPPLWFESAAGEFGAIEGFTSGFKIFDYGIISLRLTRVFKGSWQELSDVARDMMENETIERQAEQSVRRVVEHLRPSLFRPRQTLLSEDYLILAVNRLGSAHAADELVTVHGDTIAALLRGEGEPLSVQEREEVLRHRISYLEDDLVIPTWNAAFVYDTPAGTQAAVEIMEFANSQLLQFRYYDELLDRELANIYTDVQQSHRFDWLFGRRYVRAARHVHALFIDVNELTDKTEHALKIIGDVYAARLFTLIAARFDLDQWKTNVKEKLTTLNDIYRFSVEQVGIARGQFLELTIVLILVLELVLFFAGIMQ